MTYSKHSSVKIKFPNSRVAKRVLDIVKGESPEYLFNHCARTYLFAEALGATDGLNYDSEILFFAAMMHDLGIVKNFYGKTRFEVDGADAAYKILIDSGVDARAAEVVWDSIALHATPVIPLRKCAEISLVHQAAGLDTMGRRIADIPAQTVKQILEEYPRRNMKQKIISDLAQYLEQNPGGGMGYWMAEIASKYLEGAHCVTVEQTINAAPFAE